MVSTPGAVLALLGGDTMYGDLTVPQAAAGDRRIPLPTGRGLGGGSSVNTLTWFQGHPADYDGWVEQGAEGWGWDDMLPVARRVEHHILGDGPFHGAGGPMTVDFACAQRSAAPISLSAPERPSARSFSRAGQPPGSGSGPVSWSRPGAGSSSPRARSAHRTC